MRLIRTAICLLALTLFSASTNHAQKPSDDSATDGKNAPHQKLLIIADNQEHLLTGVPLTANSSRTDRIITSVARRSPLANVGGRLLFREAIRFGIREGAGLVLHLGDAADLSCPDELSAVFEALDKEAKDIWFMTPGNHDGIQVGNYVKDQPAFDYDLKDHPKVYETAPVEKFTSVPEAWLNACLSPKYLKEHSSGPARNAVLTRGDVIRRYVEMLKIRKRRWPVDREEREPREVWIADTKVTCEVEKLTIKYPNYTYTAIASICPAKPVDGDPKNRWVGPYASFIVQRLDVGKTRILMLDTSDYEKPWVRNVAFKGDLTVAQQDVADELLELEKIGRKNVIAIGHHPLAVFPRKLRGWIVERAGRYISAHVHGSASLINHGNKILKTVELNVGSTLDYPPQAVVAKIGPDAMEFRVAGAQTGWPGFLAPCEIERNRDRWKRPLSTFYRDYRRDLYSKHLLESLRVAANVAPSGQALKIPTGTNSSDWLLLEEALQTINAAEGESRIFWACQAYYASKATKDEKSWWERVPKFGTGFQRGKDVTTGGWRTLTSP